MELNTQSQDYEHSEPITLLTQTCHSGLLLKFEFQLKSFLCSLNQSMQNYLSEFRI